MALEDKVKDNESKGFIKKALNTGFNLAVAGATTVLGLATAGTLAPIVGTALAGGGVLGSMIKKKPLYDIVNDSLKTYSAINIILAPVLSVWNATIPLIPNETYVGKAARALFAATGINTVFSSLFRGAHYLIDNKLNPTGMIKHVKSNFYNEWKRSAKGFFPAYALAANGVESILGVPTFALGAAPLGFYNATNPVKVAKPKSNYGPSYAPSPAYAH